MGSFYGNIKNSNKAQFTFDKVYPNRRQADLFAGKDNVMAGRYVLVDYDYYEGVDGGWDNYNTIYSTAYTDEIFADKKAADKLGCIARDVPSAVAEYRDLGNLFDDKYALSVPDAQKKVDELVNKKDFLTKKIGTPMSGPDDDGSITYPTGLYLEISELQTKIEEFKNAEEVYDTTALEIELEEKIKEFIVSWVELNGGEDLSYQDNLHVDYDFPGPSAHLGVTNQLGDKTDTDGDSAYAELYRAKQRVTYAECFDYKEVYRYKGHVHDLTAFSSIDHWMKLAAVVTPELYYYKKNEEEEWVKVGYAEVQEFLPLGHEYYYFTLEPNSIYTSDYRAEAVNFNDGEKDIIVAKYETLDYTNYVITQANLLMSENNIVTGIETNLVILPEATEINKLDVVLNEIANEKYNIGSFTTVSQYVLNRERWQDTLTNPTTYIYYIFKGVDDAEPQWQHLTDLSYVTNYTIDTEYCETSIGRGYDGTVWQKIYANGKLAYAMLAELNSVVPTFGISADAPTEVGMAPHFDERSTNIYYQLHLQPTWGMRVKRSEIDDNGSDGLAYLSDDGDSNAIYFNKAGFNPNIITTSTQYAINDSRKGSIPIDKWGWRPGDGDIIQINSTGKSGTLYNQYETDQYGNIIYNNGYPVHDISKEMTPQVDTKEMVAMLPSLGDTVAQMWNIVYGDEKANEEYNERFVDELGSIAYAAENRHRNTNVNWDDNYTGLRLSTRGRDGYHYNTKQASTIAGAVNTAHDMIGKLVREYPVEYAYNDASLYHEATEYDLNTKYYVVDSITGEFVRSALIKDKQMFEDNKKKLYVKDVIGIDELSDRRIYYSAPKYDVANGFNENTAYFVWDERKKQFVNNKTFGGIVVRDIKSAEDYATVLAAAGTLYVVRPENEGKYLRKFTYYDYYGAPNFPEKDANNKITHISGPTTTFDATQAENLRYLETPTRIAGYDDDNVYYFSESPDFRYETRGYFEDDKDYYTITEVANSQHLLHDIYDKTEGYLWSDDNGASYFVAEDDEPNSNYTYFDYQGNTEIPEIVSDAWIYAPNTYYYVDLTQLIANEKLGLVPDRDYKIDPEGNIILSQEKENLLIPLGSVLKYDAAIAYIHKETKIVDGQEVPYVKCDPSEHMKPNRVYYYATSIPSINEHTGEQEDVIDYFTRPSKIVDFDPDYFYEIGYYVPEDDELYTKSDYPSLSKDILVKGNYNYETYNRLPADKAATALIGFRRFFKYGFVVENKDDNTTRTYEKKEFDALTPEEKANLVDIQEIPVNPVTYLAKTTYSKPYGYYYLCNARLRPSNSSWTEKRLSTNVDYNLKRIDGYYAPGEWFYYVDGVGYVCDEGPRVNNEINEKLQVIYEKYAVDGKQEDEIPQSALIQSGGYCKIRPVYVGHGWSEDRYYIKKADGTFELNHEYDPSNTTYYDQCEWYVASDENGIYTPGMKWELDFIPAGVTLSIRKPHYTMIEMPGFARTANTLNGIILKAHELMGDGEEILNNGYKNYEPDTMVGVLNTYEDHFQTHVKTHHKDDRGQFTIIDDYGRIASADFKSTQTISYTNIGDTDANPATETLEQAYIEYKPYSDDHKGVEYQIDASKSDSTTSVQTPDHQVVHLTHARVHAKDDTNTIADKNGVMAGNQGLNIGKGDNLKLYTPIVDNMGHVVGKNTETIELPYSFKTVAVSNSTSRANNTNGQFSQATQNTFVNVNEEPVSAIVADETQADITLAAGNAWLRLQTNANGQDNTHDAKPNKNSVLTLSHETHEVYTTSNGTTNLNTETGANNEDNINIPDWTYDNAGHIISKQDHKYTLPFGFKTFSLATQSTAVTDLAANTTKIVADTTQDTFTFATGNKWIKFANDADNDTMTIGHEVHAIATNGNGTDVTDRKFGDTITLRDFSYDAAGHFVSEGVHTVNIPIGSYENTPASANAVGVITGIGFTPETGAITSTSNYLGSITLGSYTKPTALTTNANTQITALDLTATSTLQNAIKSLDGRIMAEEKARADAIDGLDVAGASGIGASKTISAWSETNGKVSISTQDISIASSQINDKTDAFSATGTVAVTGKAVNAALQTLDVEGESSIGAGKTISAWSETDGKITISTQNISITASQVSNLTTAINNVIGKQATLTGTIYTSTGAAITNAAKIVPGTTYYTTSAHTTVAEKGTAYTEPTGIYAYIATNYN